MINLSALEIHHLVRELEILVGGKIEKVFQQEKPIDDFLLNIHVPGKGKNYLYINLPRAMCLTDFKPKFPDTPLAFCSSLRRKITSSRINSIKQHKFERIVVIELNTKHGKSELIIELFSSGNIILVDENKKILSVLHAKIYSEERTLLPGKQYAFPKEQLNPFELKFEDLKKLTKETTKDSLVTFLAVDCSLGGLYSEEVIYKAEIDKNKKPESLSEEEVKKIYEELKAILEKPSKAQEGEDGKPIPIVLEHLKTKDSEKSFSELIAEKILAQLEKSEETKANKEKKEQLTKFQKILKSQEQQVKGLEKSEKENTAKGEFIYKHYSEIDQLLKTIKEMRKTLSWKEIKEELKNHKFIDSIDEHEGSITINIPEEKNKKEED